MSRLKRHSTKSALKLRPSTGVKGFSRFRRYSTATPTLKKRNPLFYFKKRQKKDRKVMILSFQSRLIEATGGTLSGRGINIDHLWLNAGDEKKHGPGSDLPFFLGCHRRSSDFFTHSFGKEAATEIFQTHHKTRALSMAITITG
jgi:hypothetical protein